MTATAGVKYSLKVAGEPLFSAEEDYTYCLETFARLKQLMIAGYCLLPDEIHLLCLGHTPGLPAMLIGALTGERGHPLTKAFEQSLLPTPLLGGALVSLHQRPVAKGIAASTGAYPWSSHAAYAQGRAPNWLAADALWQQLGVRPAARARTYAEWLRPPTRALSQQTNTTTSSAEAADTDGIIARMLALHGVHMAHVSHARMRRRRMQLAGLCMAVAEQLGLNEPAPDIADAFGLERNEVSGSARQVKRSHSGLIVREAARLSGLAARKHKPQPAAHTATQDLPVTMASQAAGLESEEQSVDALTQSLGLNGGSHHNVTDHGALARD